ncbi:MAG: pentapeptide repeat-containing protein [Chloroflexota bacterium]
MTNYTLDDRLKENRDAWTFNAIETFGIFLLTIAAIVAVWGYVSEHGTLTMSNLLNDFYANVSSELASIVITVFFLDRLNQRRATEEREIELFRQTRSSSNSVVIYAVDQIQLNGLWAEFLNYYTYSNSSGKVDLSGAKWSQLASTYIQLNNVNLENAQLNNADLRHGKFQNSNLSYANLENAQLSWTSFKNANLKSANLQKSQLSFAKLEHADLRFTNLRLARLEYAHLEHTDLMGTDLRNTSLKGAKNIESALFDAQTILPDSNCIFINGDTDLCDKYWTPDTDMTVYTKSDYRSIWDVAESRRQQRENNQSD